MIRRRGFIRHRGVQIGAATLAAAGILVLGIVTGAQRGGAMPLPTPDEHPSKADFDRIAHEVAHAAAQAQPRSVGAHAHDHLPELSPDAAESVTGNLEPIFRGVALRRQTGIDHQDVAVPSTVDPRFADLAQHMPPFLREETDYFTQLEQMDAYFQHTPAKDLWRAHLAPALEERAAATSHGPYSLSEIEDFRGQLTDFSLDIQTLLEQQPRELVFDQPEKQVDFRDLVANMPADDLGLLKDAFVDYPGFWELPGYLVDMSQSPPPFSIVTPEIPGVAPARATVPSDSVTIPQRAGCGPDTTCGSCPAQPAGGPTTVFALKGAELAANGFCGFLDADFFVVSIEVPAPWKLACAFVQDAVANSRLAVEGAQEVYAECEQNYHRGMVHALLDATVASRASQVSFDYYDQLTLRLGIEDNLLGTLDDRVSTYQLPASQGGLLNATDSVSVRFIVRNTIDMNVAAGMDIGNAEDEYAAAEAHLAAGEWKDAYARYRKAYRAAVGIGRGTP